MSSKMNHRGGTISRWVILTIVVMVAVGRTLAQQPPAAQQVAEARGGSSTPSSSTASASAPAQDAVSLNGMLLTSTIEVGARRRDVQGNDDVYRSHVNLGNGLKLLHGSTELSAPESSGRWFDRLSIAFDHWGGEPYNTAEVQVKKNLTYDFQYRYQKIDYFHFIPEFANPLFGQGVNFGQHSSDSTRRMSNARLTIFPNAQRLQLHAAYARNSAFGPAFSTANLGGDEFVIGRHVKNRVNDYRAGFDLRLWKLGISFEQAWRDFNNDEGYTRRDYTAGNDAGLLFDAYQLFIDRLRRNDYVRGLIPTTRIAIVSHQIPRVVFNARLYYSDAETDSTYGRTFTGLVFNRDLGIFATSELSASRAAPSKPYTVGDGTLRVHLGRRLAVIHTLRGSHYVIAGERILRDRLVDADVPDMPVLREEVSYRRTSLRSVMNQVQGEMAITNNLLVRAGHRVNHRRALFQQRDQAFDSITGPDLPSLDRARDEDVMQTAHTLLLGGSYRLRRLVRVALDYENGGYLTEFIRVDTRDFQRGRLRLQLKPNEQWSFTAFGAVSDQTRPSRSLAQPRRTNLNQNRSRSGGFSVSWFPTQRLAFDVDYTRGYITAHINTIDLTREGVARPLILYMETSDVLHAGADLTLFRGIRSGLGYRWTRSRGSYPICFHRPYAHLAVPLHRAVSLGINYQRYDYDEQFRSVQDYHANLLTTSLRFSF